jgi:hypothetical protein
VVCRKALKIVLMVPAEIVLQNSTYSETPASKNKQIQQQRLSTAP